MLGSPETRFLTEENVTSRTAESLKSISVSVQVGENPGFSQKKMDEMGLRNEQDVAIEAKRDNGSPAALVIGGGIAGMQAALDIADAGFKVYLVEREPTIGGHMAQLDKTFPTLDCSACIMTPKMVDVTRNPNIELMTYSEVIGVQGHKGRFRVTVRNKPRYVDIVKCTGCGDCVKNCPVEVDSEFDQGLVKRTAIYRPFPQAVPNAVVIDKKETPPCKMACPVHMDVHPGHPLLLYWR